MADGDPKIHRSVYDVGGPNGGISLANSGGRLCSEHIVMLVIKNDAPSRFTVGYGYVQQVSQYVELLISHTLRSCRYVIRIHERSSVSRQRPKLAAAQVRPIRESEHP